MRLAPQWRFARPIEFFSKIIIGHKHIQSSPFAVVDEPFNPQKDNPNMKTDAEPLFDPREQRWLYIANSSGLAPVFVPEVHPTYKLNSFQELWLKALYFKEYAQTIGKLWDICDPSDLGKEIARHIDKFENPNDPPLTQEHWKACSFCCLGVAQMLDDPSALTRFPQDSSLYDMRTNRQQKMITVLKLNLSKTGETHLISMNDSRGLSFHQIANIILQDPLHYFNGTRREYDDQYGEDKFYKSIVAGMDLGLTFQ